VERGLAKQEAFRDNMTALKASGVFWRTDFPVDHVYHSSRLNLLTSQWLVALYFNASGIQGVPEGFKFELQEGQGVLPWSSAQPTNVPASPIPSTAPSPSTTIGWNAPSPYVQFPVFSIGSGGKRPPLRPKTLKYTTPPAAPTGPMPSAAAAATSPSDIDMDL
jgi:hypothetical protein